MATGLALFILFGFAQFALRGMVDYRQVPVVVHLHAAAMTSWLLLLIAQANLPTRGGLALHKTLGWASLALVPLIVVLAIATGWTVLAQHLVPPFFTAPYFLALIFLDVLVFAGLVGWAVVWRKRSAWHKRLMLGSTIILLEPALGRLLPMPLLGGMAHWVEMGCQLVAVAILVAHDRRELKAVHPASLLAGVAVIFAHAAIASLAIFPPWQGLAASITA